MENGQAPVSDNEEYCDRTDGIDIDEMDIDNELIHIAPRYRFEITDNMEEVPVLTKKHLKQAEAVDGIMWNYDTPTEPPTIFPSYSPTHLKEECKRLFTTPLHSLLQFIPIGIWILMVQESNKYANEK